MAHFDRFAEFLKTSRRFDKNQPNEIFSHLSEKPSKGTFLKPEMLKNHSKDRKGKEKRKEREEGKEEKKKQAIAALLDL